MHINAQCFKQRMKRKEVGIRRTHKFRPGDLSHTLRALTSVTYWDGAKFQPQGRFFFFFFHFYDDPLELTTYQQKTDFKIGEYHSCAKHMGVEADAHTCALNQIPRTRDVTHLGSVSRNSRELFVPEKPVVQLQSAFFERLIFLTCL